MSTGGWKAKFVKPCEIMQCKPHWVVIIAMLILSLPVDARQLPKNLLSKIPKGYIIDKAVSGFIDGNRTIDWVVVLKSKTVSNAVRPLLIYLNESPAIRNDNVVWSFGYDGKYDNSLKSIIIRKHKVVIAQYQNSGNSKGAIITYYAFSLSAGKLVLCNYYWYNPATKPEYHYRKTGKVPFKTFNYVDYY